MLINFFNYSPKTTRFKLFTIILIIIYKIALFIIFREKLPETGTFVNVKQYLRRNPAFDTDKQMIDYDIIVRELVRTGTSSDNKRNNAVIMEIVKNDTTPRRNSLSAQDRKYTSVFGNWMKQNSPLFLNILVSFLIYIIFLHDLYCDYKTGIIFLVENLSLSMFMIFALAIFFTGIVHLGKDAFYFELLTEDLQENRGLFLNTLFFDSFITFFLLHFLFFKECTRGKQLERIASQARWNEYVELNLIMVLATILITENYYYHKIDNDISLWIKLFSFFFSLCITLERTRSFISVYALFIVIQLFALFTKWVFPK